MKLQKITLTSSWNKFKLTSKIRQNKNREKLQREWKKKNYKKRKPWTKIGLLKTLNNLHLVSRSSHQEPHNVGESLPSSVANQWKKLSVKLKRCKKRGLKMWKIRDRQNKTSLIWEKRWRRKLRQKLRKSYKIRKMVKVELKTKIPTMDLL